MEWRACCPRIARTCRATLLAALMGVPSLARAQDDAGPPPIADTTGAVAVDRYANLYSGQFTDRKSVV